MRVWAPAWRLMSWSSEIEFCRLTRMSAPVSQTSTVLWPTSKRLEGCDIPPKMDMSLRWAASGSRGLVSAYSEPPVPGNQVQPSAASAESCLGIATPLPKKNAQKRFGRPAGGSAFAIASSQGKANDSPAPRRNVRRSRCHEGRAMVADLSDPDDISDPIRSNDSCALLRLKRLAADDQLDEGRKAVFTGAESRHQSIRGVGVAA